MINPASICVIYLLEIPLRRNYINRRLLPFANYCQSELRLDDVCQAAMEACMELEGSFVMLKFIVEKLYKYI